MKKLFGLLCAVALVFTCMVRVNAKTITVDDIITQVKTDNPSFSSVSANTNASDSSKLDIMFNGSNVMTVGYVDGVMTYNGEPSNSITDLVLENILNAVFKLQNQNKNNTDFKEEVKGNPSKYTYAQNKIEATVNNTNNYTYLKVDTNNVNLAGTTTNNNTSSSTSTETNPKTGVFVPVFGISVLIIGSVVCLIWIGKNNVFKGL